MPDKGIKIKLPPFPKSKRKRIRNKALKKIGVIVENAILREKDDKG